MFSQAPGDELGVAPDGSAAGRTPVVDVLRQIKRPGSAGALVRDNGDDGRDYLAGLLDDHRVADPDVLALDLFLVVGAWRARLSSPPGNTGSSSATASACRCGHLDRDGLQHGLGLFVGVLVAIA